MLVLKKFWILDFRGCVTYLYRMLSGTFGSQLPAQILPTPATPILQVFLS
jgi:hypothetical protein